MINRSLFIEIFYNILNKSNEELFFNLLEYQIFKDSIELFEILNLNNLILNILYNKFINLINQNQLINILINLNFIDKLINYNEKDELINLFLNEIFKLNPF